MSAADDMRDRFIAHQIYLQRFAGGLRNRLLEVLNKSDDPLAKKLSEELQAFEGLTPQETAEKFQKLESLVNSITGVRDDAWQQVQKDFLDEIKALSEHEYDFTTSVIRAVLPDSVEVLAVPVERIAAAVGSRPFEGRLLKDWADDLKAADLTRLKDSITQGVIEGRTVDEMVRIVRGTKAADYADGILQISRRNAESVIRTSVNHVSNVARDDVFAANSDIIAGVKWVSTLDGRTSAICRGRDGHVAPTPGREDELPEGYPRLNPSSARPPAHWGCRSTVVAVFDLATISEQLGERPYVRDSRTRQQREIDFRAAAKADVGEAEWKRLGEEGRKPLIKAKRDAWAAANIGRVPSGTTYDEWLRKQPDWFQDDVLGKWKADLFRQGMRLDRFVDQAGKEMTLDQLKALTGSSTPRAKKASTDRRSNVVQQLNPDQKQLRIITGDASREFSDPITQERIDKVRRRMQQQFDALEKKRLDVIGLRDSNTESTMSRLESDFRKAISERDWDAAKKATIDARAIIEEERNKVARAIRPDLRSEIRIDASATLKSRSEGEIKKATDFLNEVLGQVHSQNTRYGDAQSIVKSKMVATQAGRSRFTKGRIELSNGTQARTIVHELGHQLETTGEVHELAKGFLHHRVGGEPAKSLRKVFGSHFSAHEQGREDDFLKLWLGFDFGNPVDPKSWAFYSGKHYQGATEIVSMGVEALFSDPIRMAKQDPEFFRFIVGVLNGNLLFENQ